MRFIVLSQDLPKVVMLLSSFVDICCICIRCCSCHRGLEDVIYFSDACLVLFEFYLRAAVAIRSFADACFVPF